MKFKGNGTRLELEGSLSYRSSTVRGTTSWPFTDFPLSLILSRHFCIIGITLVSTLAYSVSNSPVLCILRSSIFCSSCKQRRKNNNYLGNIEMNENNLQTQARGFRNSLNFPWLFPDKCKISLTNWVNNFTN